jgi:hypothetical protein
MMLNICIASGPRRVVAARGTGGAGVTLFLGNERNTDSV